MGFLDSYRRRLGVNGQNVGEVYHSSTVAFKQEKFNQSPTFRVLEVKSFEFPEIKKMDARVINVERLGTLREVLFRPYQGLNLGTYVRFDNETWLISDMWGSIENGQQKVLVQNCNRFLKWKDSNDELNIVDCIASQSPLGSKASQGKNDIEFNAYDVRLATGQLFVFVEKNEKTSRISLNQRFILGSNVYEVYGLDDTTSIDKSGYGIIQILVKLTTRQSADDFENGIAYNKYKNDSAIEIPKDTDVSLPEEDTDEDEEDTGGLPW